MTDEILAHPEGHQQVRLLAARLRRGGTGGDVEEAIAKARGDGIVIEREYRQQRLVPAFMEPRSTVVDPTGGRSRCGPRRRSPHPPLPHRRDHRYPRESKVRVIAPTWAAASAANSRPRRGSSPSPCPGAGQAGEIHRDPFRVFALRPPRSRPVPGSPSRRPRTAPSPASRSTSSPTSAPMSPSSAAGCRCWARGCSARSTRFPAYRFNCQTVLADTTWVDAYRGASRWATFAIEADHGRTRRRGRRGPARIPSATGSEARGVPASPRWRAWYDSRQLRGGDRTGKEGLFGYDDLRAEQKARRSRNDGPTRHRRHHLHRMCGLAPPGSWASSLRRRGWESASIRMLPTGKVEVITGHQPARPEPTRPRGARSSPTASGCPFGTSVLHGDTQVAYRASDTYANPLPRRRRRGRGPAADKVIRKARPSPPTPRANVDDLEGSPAVGRYAVKGHRQGHRHHRGGARDLRLAQLPRGISGRASTPDATFDPVDFSLPPAPTCAPWGSTPRRATTGWTLRLRRRHQPHHPTRSSSRSDHGGLVRASLRRSGGSGLRRQRHPGDGVRSSIHPADGGRHDLLRHRQPTSPWRPTPQDRGVGEGGHHRVDAGGSSNAIVDARDRGALTYPMPCTGASGRRCGRLARRT